MSRPANGRVVGRIGAPSLLNQLSEDLDLLDRTAFRLFARENPQLGESVVETWATLDQLERSCWWDRVLNAARGA